MKQSPFVVSLRWLLIASFTFSGVLPGSAAVPVNAGTVVGNGTPASCTRAALEAALAVGGSITFNCGPNPVIISLHPDLFAEYFPALPVPVSASLEGGGLVTLGAAARSRVMEVSPGVTLHLSGLTLRGGLGAQGGCLYSESATVVLDQVTITDCSGDQGGAVFSTGGSLEITSSLFVSNTAGAAGAIYSLGTLSVADSEFAYNQATSGYAGALYAFGSALISNSWLHHNQAQFGAGAAVLSGGQALIEHSQFGANTAGSSASDAGGGALINTSTLTVTQSTFSGNSTNGCGGAIRNGGILRLVTSAVVTNTAANCGGGLSSTLVLTIENSTLSHNTAAKGGGLYAGLLATLTQVTLQNTATTNGHNVYADELTSVYLQGSLLSFTSVTGVNCYRGSGSLGTGQIVSNGGNVADDMSCQLTAGSDQLAQGTLLGALADNGGPTLTQLPVADSAAIDADPSPNCPMMDQRGYVRPQGEACDAGAVEFGAGVPVPVVSPVVISQVYGGGGEAGAEYTNDFVELFNGGSVPVSLAGWSIQYAAAGGAEWQVAPLGGSIQPGHYYLVQLAAGAGGSLALPAPDASSPIVLHPSAGKVALVSRTTPLNISQPVGWPFVRDFVGYGTANGYEGAGPAAGPSNTSVAWRLAHGCQDTNDNAVDFVGLAPQPRNSGWPATDCDAPPPMPPTSPPSPTPTRTPLPGPTATVPPSDAPPIILTPSNLPGAVKPTLSVNPAQGYAGQSVSVNGVIPNGYPQVSLAWVVNGQSITAKTVQAGSGGAYATTLLVPAALPAGPAQLCGLVTEAPQASLACTAFTVTQPPAGSVQGSIPIGQGSVRNAHFNLLDSAGQVIYSAAIGADGRFNLNGVRPSTYRYSVTGEVPESRIAMGVAEIESQINIFNLVMTHCDTPAGAQPSRSQGLVRYSARTGQPATQQVVRPFGLYFSQVENNVTFSVSPQVSTGEVVQKVVFKFYNRDDQQVGPTLEDAAAPYQAVYNVGQLPPSRGGRNPYLLASVIVNGQERCWTIYDLEVMANPFTQSYIQPPPDSLMWWDAGARVYRFKGVIPYVPNLLPLDQTIPPDELPALPYLGRFDNRLNAGLSVEGWINLEGDAQVNVIRAIASAKVMNEQVFDAGVDLVRPNARFRIDELRTLSLPVFSPDDPFELLPRLEIKTPEVTYPVITFFGLIDVTVSGSASAAAALTVWGRIYPFFPAVEAHLTAKGEASATLGMGVRALAGIAAAGGNATAYTSVELPLVIQAGYDGDGVYADAYFDPVCANFQVSVTAWAEALWGIAREEATQYLVNETPCIGLQTSAMAGGETVPGPDLLAEPALASASDGRALQALVANMATEGASPQVQVLVRFRNPGTGVWDSPATLGNPAHSARSPVVAFVGPAETPLVAWVENTLTEAEALALGDDVNAHAQRQEIFYSLYNGTTWGAPVQLTDDEAPDGLPALGGSDAGAVLAWTRDLDGDLATRLDQRVAVARWDLGQQAFGSFHLLAGPGGGMNNDVSVAYDESTDPPTPYVAWTNDADGDLTTAGDRRIAVAKFANQAWSLLEAGALPARADSPAIAVGAHGLRLAFLVRQGNGSGEVPLLGANGALWTARFASNTWTAGPLLDEEQQLVFAERPLLAAHEDETLLLFRRFGEVGTPAGLGQLALSQIIGAGAPSAPLYLTDSALPNWQQALSLDPVTQQALIMSVESDFGGSTAQTASAAGAAQALPQMGAQTLTTTGDPVTALALEFSADPAIDPLGASSTAPAPGAPLTVLATVRNMGRSSSGAVTAKLYWGTPATGTLLATAPVVPPLDFNEQSTVTFTVAAPGGLGMLTAALSTPGENASTTNDTAGLALGALTRPAPPQGRPSSLWVDSLELAWSTGPDEYITGYRVLRGDSPVGPFTLVGETALEQFTDTQVTRGVTYCYVVQAYNASGGLSPLSPAGCAALELYQVYLPAVGR